MLSQIGTRSSSSNEIKNLKINFPPELVGKAIKPEDLKELIMTAMEEKNLIFVTPDGIVAPHIACPEEIELVFSQKHLGVDSLSSEKPHLNETIAFESPDIVPESSEPSNRNVEIWSSPEIEAYIDGLCEVGYKSNRVPEVRKHPKFGTILKSRTRNGFYYKYKWLLEQTDECNIDVSALHRKRLSVFKDMLLKHASQPYTKEAWKDEFDREMTGFEPAATNVNAGQNEDSNVGSGGETDVATAAATTAATLAPRSPGVTEINAGITEIKAAEGESEGVAADNVNVADTSIVAGETEAAGDATDLVDADMGLAEMDFTVNPPRAFEWLYPKSPRI